MMIAMMIRKVLTTKMKMLSVKMSRRQALSLAGVMAAKLRITERRVL